MKRIRRIIAIGVLSTGICFSACDRGGGDAPAKGPVPTEWKIAIEEIQGSVQDAWAQRFKEKVESRTRRAVGVTVYPYGSLGTSAQLTELVQNGAIQLAMASPGHLGKLIPETQLFLLHFVFSDDNVVNRRVLAHDGKLRQVFAPLYAKKGLELLSFFPEGWQVWTTRKPIRKPADFEGLKIRVMTSPLVIEAYRAYGANPTPMPYSEVYSGLQLKMIDGQVNPIFAIEEMSFYEVAEILTIAKQSQFVTSVIANPVFLKELERAQREILEQVVTELEGEIFEVQRQYNEERLDRIREKNPDAVVEELDEEQRGEFRVASLPVRERYVEQTGEGGRAILDLLLGEVERAEAALAVELHESAKSVRH